jgi:hypothetical protein
MLVYLLTSRNPRRDRGFFQFIQTDKSRLTNPPPPQTNKHLPSPYQAGPRPPWHRHTFSPVRKPRQQSLTIQDSPRLASQQPINIQSPTNANFLLANLVQHGAQRVHKASAALTLWNSLTFGWHHRKGRSPVMPIPPPIISSRSLCRTALVR